MWWKGERNRRVVVVVSLCNCTCEDGSDEPVGGSKRGLRSSQRLEGSTISDEWIPIIGGVRRLSYRWCNYTQRDFVVIEGIEYSISLSYRITVASA